MHWLHTRAWFSIDVTIYPNWYIIMLNKECNNHYPCFRLLIEKYRFHISSHCWQGNAVSLLLGWHSFTLSIPLLLLFALCTFVTWQHAKRWLQLDCDEWTSKCCHLLQVLMCRHPSSLPQHYGLSCFLQSIHCRRYFVSWLQLALCGYI